MALSITHQFISAKSDGPDSSVVQASNWNESHAITMATGKVLGRTTAGTGAVEELDPSDIGALESGTRMLFQQTAAPTGWTKDTTANLNDTGVRIVTGSVSSRTGQSAFSTVFGLTSTDDHQLTVAEMPAHDHSFTGDAVPDHSHALGSGTGFGQGAIDGYEDDGNTSKNSRPAGGHTPTGTIGSTGGDGSHSHNIDLRVNYHDFIIAVKD